MLACVAGGNTYELRRHRARHHGDYFLDRGCRVEFRHLFRTSAASTAKTYGGDNPHLASALLHHTHPSITEAHYNRATSLTATDSFRQITGSTRKIKFEIT